MVRLSARKRLIVLTLLCSFCFRAPRPLNNRMRLTASC